MRGLAYPPRDDVEATALAPLLYIGQMSLGNTSSELSSGGAQYPREVGHARRDCREELHQIRGGVRDQQDARLREDIYIYIYIYMYIYTYIYIYLCMYICICI